LVGLTALFSNPNSEDGAPVATLPDPLTPEATEILEEEIAVLPPRPLQEAPLPIGWSRIPHDEAVFQSGQEMLSVTSRGPGLVAVGLSGVGPSGVDRDGTDAAVWTSSDGITWSRVPHDMDVFGGGKIEMRSVTVGGPGLVAVGLDGSGYIEDWDAAVWTSVDGITWSRVPHDLDVFGPGEMRSVTAGGPGLVAVGQEGIGYSDETGRPGRQDAAVWTSVDGFTWSRVPYDEAVFGGPSNQSMVSVTAGGPGLVAVGWDDTNAAVWTSVDGITWSRVPHDESVFGFVGRPSMVSVTAGGPGLVAVGSDDSDAAVWTSVDGITWSRVPHDQPVFGEPGMLRMTAVTATNSGLVAVGFQRPGGTVTWSAETDAETAAVWTSVDGIAWSRVPHDQTVSGADHQEMLSVTVWGPGLVAVGQEGRPYYGGYSNPLAAVWMTAP
jgi:hypothetical protein